MNYLILIVLKKEYKLNKGGFLNYANISMNKIIFLSILFFSGCYLFPYQDYYKNEIKASGVIYKQKPIMYIARERKMFFIRILIREKDVFTLTTDGFYGCGIYKISNDSITLKYFDTDKIKGKQDTIIFNMKDSTAQFKTFLSPQIEILRIIPPEKRYFTF